MLNEKNLLKPLSEQFLLKRLDLSIIDTEILSSFEAYVCKDKNGKFIIFDKVYSIEIEFEDQNGENLLKKQSTRINFEGEMLDCMIKINKFKIEIFLENTLKMLIESFELLPTKIKLDLISPLMNINNDEKIKLLIDEILKQTEINQIKSKKEKENYNCDEFEEFYFSQDSYENKNIIIEENLANIDITKILINSNNRNIIKENPFSNENSNTKPYFRENENEKNEENEDNKEFSSSDLEIIPYNMNVLYDIFDSNNIINSNMSEKK